MQEIDRKAPILFIRKDTFHYSICRNFDFTGVTADVSYLF